MVVEVRVRGLGLVKINVDEEKYRGCSCMEDVRNGCSTSMDRGL